MRILLLAALLAGCAAQPDYVALRAETSRQVMATHLENQRDEAEAMEAYTRVLIDNNRKARPSDWEACGARSAMVVGNFHAHENVRQGCLNTRVLEREGR